MVLCSTLHYGGKGELSMTTLMSGHGFIYTIKALRTFFRHLSKTHIRENAFVAVALNQSSAMYQGYRFMSWRSLHNICILPNTSACRRCRPHAPKAIEAATAAATHVS